MDRECTTRTQNDGVAVESCGAINKRGRGKACWQASLERAIDFDVASACGCLTIRASTRVQGKGVVFGDLGATRVVVRVTQGNRAKLANLGAIDDIGKLRAYLHKGRNATVVRKHVVHATEDESAVELAIPSSTVETVNRLIGQCRDKIRRSSTQSRREVGRFHVLTHAVHEEGASITQGCHVQRCVIEGNAKPEAHTVGAAELRAAAENRCRVETVVENHFTHGGAVAQNLQWCAAETAVASQTQHAARHYCDTSGAERRSCGRGDLQHALENVGSAAVDIRRIVDDQHSGGVDAREAHQGTRTRYLPGELNGSAGIRAVQIEGAIRACKGSSAGHAEAVVAATGPTQRVFGHHQVVDLEGVTGVGREVVHVNGDRAAHVYVDAIGRRIAENDGAVDPAAVALEE